MLVASMVFGMCQAYEHSRQHGKHECLYKSHKQFQKVHKNGKEYRYNRHRATKILIYRRRYKYKTNKHEQCGVPCKNISKEPHSECKRFHKNTNKFNERH